MNNDLYIIGEIGMETTLNSVVKDVQASDKTKPLNVHIHSVGGGVYDGLAIYNYLKGLDQEVNTFSSGLVASIASIIFLAGNKKTRSINSTDNFLIHLPSGFAGGNAEDFEKNAKELRDIEEKLSTIYANETDITKDEALDLMKKDEMMDINFLKEKGFVANIIEFKAVAKFNKNDMSTETLTKVDAENMFEKFFNKFFPKKTEPTNKIVQDANGTDIDFTNVADDATPQINDTAMVDGAKAEGDYVMPNGETFRFMAGALTEIIEADNSDDTEALKQEIADLKEQLQAKADLEETITGLEAKEIEMKTEMTALKNKVVSSFEYDIKDKRHPNFKPENTTRKSLIIKKISYGE